MDLLGGNFVGIDLGTSASAVAWVDRDGTPSAIKNADGQDVTPSEVLLADEGVFVGARSDGGAQLERGQVVEAVKPQLGRDDALAVYENKQLTPEFMSALILKKLKQDAERRIGEVTDAVLTVPGCFSDKQRERARDAGRIAGLNVVTLLQDSIAITLYDAWRRREWNLGGLSPIERTILVFDLGGGTFDVSVLRRRSSNIRILATAGDVRLGGRLWTERLVDNVAQRLADHRLDDSRKHADKREQLTRECEQAKCRLSTVAETAIRIRGVDDVALTRSDFQRMTADLLRRTRVITRRVLQIADVDSDQLDAIVLSGAACCMPAVAQMLEEVCGREVAGDPFPPESVAIGAAVYSKILGIK